MSRGVSLLLSCLIAAVIAAIALLPMFLQTLNANARHSADAFGAALHTGESRISVRASAKKLGGYALSGSGVMPSDHTTEFVRFEELGMPCTSHGKEYALYFDSRDLLESWTDREYEEAC